MKLTKNYERDEQNTPMIFANAIVDSVFSEYFDEDSSVNYFLEMVDHLKVYAKYLRKSNRRWHEVDS